MTPREAASAGGTSEANIEPLATGGCTHQREVPGYTPPPSLRHLIEVRDKICSFPTCRRTAEQCDLDHTLAYHNGGRTCPCNLHPLAPPASRGQTGPGLAADPAGTWHPVLDDPVRAQLPDNPISQPPAQPMSATLIGIPAALAGLAAAGYGLSSTRARRPQSQSLRGVACLGSAIMRGWPANPIVIINLTPPQRRGMDVRGAGR